MPSLDRVNAPPDRFLDGNWPEFTLLDLAYEEYVARDCDGAATAHVEDYWAHLARASMTRPCIGFGSFEGVCLNTAGPRNVALLWCDRCEDLRRRHLSGQFDAITKSFEEG